MGDTHRLNLNFNPVIFLSHNAHHRRIAIERAILRVDT